MHPPDLLQVVRPDLADVRLAAHGRIIQRPPTCRGGPLAGRRKPRSWRFIAGRVRAGDGIAMNVLRAGRASDVKHVDGGPAPTLDGELPEQENEGYLVAVGKDDARPQPLSGDGLEPWRR